MKVKKDGFADKTHFGRFRHFYFALLLLIIFVGYHYYHPVLRWDIFEGNSYQYFMYEQDLIDEDYNKSVAIIPKLLKNYSYDELEKIFKENAHFRFSIEDCSTSKEYLGFGNLSIRFDSLGKVCNTNLYIKPYESPVTKDAELYTPLISYIIEGGGVIPPPLSGMMSIWLFFVLVVAFIILGNILLYLKFKNRLRLHAVILYNTLILLLNRVY